MELKQQFDKLCTQLFKQYELSVNELNCETRIRIGGKVHGETELPWIFMQIELDRNNLYVSKFCILNEERASGWFTNNGCYDELIIDFSGHTECSLLTVEELFEHLPEVVQQAVANKKSPEQPLWEASNHREETIENFLILLDKTVGQVTTDVLYKQDGLLRVLIPAVYDKTLRINVATLTLERVVTASSNGEYVMRTPNVKLADITPETLKELL